MTAVAWARQPGDAVRGRQGRAGDRQRRHGEAEHEIGGHGQIGVADPTIVAAPGGEPAQVEEPGAGGRTRALPPTSSSNSAASPVQETTTWVAATPSQTATTADRVMIRQLGQIDPDAASSLNVDCTIRV